MKFSSSSVRVVSFVLSLSTLHCANITSSYVPRSASAHEIVLGYDDQVIASKGGETLSLGDLPDAVACIPEARAEASKANLAANVANGFGLVGLAGVASGAGLVVYGGIEDRGNILVAGVVTAGAAAVTGLVWAIIRGSVMPNQLDAINRYNDSHLDNPSCSAR